jgi:hypothetical protein
VRGWVPATVVAVLLAVGIGTAAYFTLGRGTGRSISPTPSVALHSKEAVVAAIRHYYDVEAEARKTGNADLIDAVTIGHNSIASQNFHAYVSEQAARGKRSIILQNYYADWVTSISGDKANVNFTFWLKGHAINASTGQAVEADMLTRKSHYQMLLQLVQGRWLVSERDLLSQDAA